MSGLARFVTAQATSYDQACAEVARGRKDGHWMWFVFPQLRGLGRSETAVFYGLDGRAEAEAYLAHPVLGPRLVAISTALLAQPNLNAVAVMGSVDALKLRSSMTLFASLGRADPVFAEVLTKFFGGERDALTVAMLRAG